MEQELELQGSMPAAYHVFINHRGTDTKHSLASLIYHCLTKYHNLGVFLDKNEIRTGDTISDTILNAIQSATVNIAIFSQRYAESSWCLDELHWMLRSHHKRHRKVIPVFYDVQPTDLRHIDSGCYRNAFEKHQSNGRVSMDKMEKWKNALIEASNLSGVLFKTEESDQGEILDKIVGIVLEEVFKWGPLEVAKYPVGLEQAAEDYPINEIVKQGELNQTMVVRIVGMSGAGKSTLAKYLYNLRRPNFNGRSCFLSEVKKMDLQSLQRKLLRDLIGYDQDFDIDKGKHILRHCRILLVLDDVDQMDQIDGLLDIDSVGCGSLIFITSRDRELLRRPSPNTLLYHVKPLNREHARQLFCQHAFRQSKPPEELKALVEEFLEICKGLPLSLKVLGGHFVGRPDKEYWKRQLVRFSTTLHDDIINTLKVSYHALNPREKEAFLDIGCFLVEEETELAIRVLNGLYGSNIVHSLESLHQKCFVDFRYDVQSNDEIECREQPDNPMIGYSDLSLQYRGYKLTMHDQLRELARHIAREARESFRVLPTVRIPLRLTSSNDIFELWQSQRESFLPIRGIRTWKDEKPPGFSELSTIKCEGVHLVVLEVPLTIDPIDFGLWEFRGDLVWLRLTNFRNESIRYFSSSSLRSLRVLELKGHGDSIEGFVKRFMAPFMKRTDERPSRLNELNISDAPPIASSSSLTFDQPGHSMESHENYIASAVQQGGVTPRPTLFKFIEWIGLGIENLCKMVFTNLTFLPSLPVDFGELASLRHLDLSGCTNLRGLPKSFSKLLQLQYLALRECRNLSIPQDILGEISTLEFVDFKGCAQLVDLPQGIPYQKGLRHLNLLFTSLSQLPENVQQLGNLEQLRIGTPHLTRLPVSLAKLNGLKELTMIQCSHLECLLPEGIATPNIKILTIDCCPIANFSASQKDHGTLRDLTLKKTSIFEICISEGIYPCLQILDLSENIRLKQVIALPSALVTVNLQNCWELKALKNLSNLVHLKSLNINRCFELKTLTVEGLISLERISAQKCWKLEKIDGLSSLKRLKCLKISTDNGIFWKSLCKLSKWSSSHELSYFIIAGKMDKGAFDRLRSDFEYSSVDRGMYPISAVKMEDTDSGILLCFISENMGCHSFHLNLYAHGELVGKPNLKCEIDDGEGTHVLWGGGRRLHVFMWTQYTKLFQELKAYPRISVAVEGRGNPGGGWLLRPRGEKLDNETDVLKVWDKMEGMITESDENSSGLRELSKNSDT